MDERGGVFEKKFSDFDQNEKMVRSLFVILGKKKGV